MPRPRITSCISTIRLTNLQYRDYATVLPQLFGETHTCDQIARAGGAEEESIVSDKIARHCYSFGICYPVCVVDDVEAQCKVLSDLA